MINPDIRWLFDTDALKIAPADSPFWYTSGLIGPYYISTQYLCGGPQMADDILAFIDRAKDDVFNFPFEIQERLHNVYESHEIYRQTIDALADYLRSTLPLDEVDYISGGERRDWFFAPIMARELNKSCLYIYNDKTVYDGDGKVVENLAGAVVLNIADLLTVGSSITDKWIPAIRTIGGELRYAANVVDRHQGGGDNLVHAGIKQAAALFTIDHELFDQALEQGLIDEGQHRLVLAYLEDPEASMRDFLKHNPGFLEQAQKSDDPKTQKRARKLIESDLYGLGR